MLKSKRSVYKSFPTFPRLFASPDTKEFCGIGLLREQVSTYLHCLGFGKGMKNFGSGEPPKGWPSENLDWGNFKGPKRSCGANDCKVILQSILEAHNIDFFMYGPKKGDVEHEDEHADALLDKSDEEVATEVAAEVAAEVATEVATEEIVDKTDNKRKRKYLFEALANLRKERKKDERPKAIEEGAGDEDIEPMRHEQNIRSNIVGNIAVVKPKKKANKEPISRKSARAKRPPKKDADFIQY